MPLCISQIMRGAIVAVAFDDKGRRLSVQRRGIIVNVETIAATDEKGNITEVEMNGDPRNGISKIWVQFERGAEAEVVQARNLAVVREYDKAESGRLRRDAMNELGEQVAEAGEPVLVIDKTELESAKPMTQKDVDEFQKPAKRGPGRPRKNPEA